MAMSVGVLDHYNVSTRKLNETVRFYEDVLGFTNGPRPPFNFPGAWLYAGEKPEDLFGLCGMNGGRRFVRRCRPPDRWGACGGGAIGIRGSGPGGAPGARRGRVGRPGRLVPGLFNGMAIALSLIAVLAFAELAGALFDHVAAGRIRPDTPAQVCAQVSLQAPSRPVLAQKVIRPRNRFAVE